MGCTKYLPLSWVCGERDTQKIHLKDGTHERFIKKMGNTKYLFKSIFFIIYYHKSVLRWDTQKIWYHNKSVLGWDTKSNTLLFGGAY